MRRLLIIGSEVSFRRGGDAHAVQTEKASAIRSSSSGSPSSSTPYRVQDVNCLNPFLNGAGDAFPCGKCPSCISRKRRVWTHRIMLEAAQWDFNSFATLTYSDENLPEELQPDHLTLFLKRLRARWKSPLRFYACGEYSPSLRPHFHLALFNFPMCLYVGHKQGDCPCRPCSAVREAWGYGHILLGSLEAKSAGYIAGYVTKKMSTTQNLGKRRPEFARMSRRPGIGAGAMWDVASVLLTYPRIVNRTGDVPLDLKHGVRQLPLGPFLRRKLRAYIGTSERAPVRVLEAAREPLRPLSEFARRNAPPGYRNEIVKAYLSEWNEQWNRNVQARSIRKVSLK